MTAGQGRLTGTPGSRTGARLNRCEFWGVDTRRRGAPQRPSQVEYLAQTGALHMQSQMAHGMLGTRDAGTCGVSCEISRVCRPPASRRNRQTRIWLKMSCVGLLSSQLEVWLTMCLLQAAGMIDCMGLARMGEGWRPSRCRKFVEGKDHRLRLVQLHAARGGDVRVDVVDHDDGVRSCRKPHTGAHEGEPGRLA